MKRSDSIARAVLGYAFLGCVWILVTDRLVAWLWPRLAEYHQFQSAKGILYVLITAMVLSHVWRRWAAAWYAATQRSQLAEMALQESQKMELLAVLAGGVAHDFNNLLTVIAGNLDALPATTPEEQEAVEEVREASQRAVALTRQLLDFARKREGVRIPVDLAGAVADAAKLIRRILGKQIELRLNCDAGAPAILGDPNKIQQILLNLAVNSRDAMPQGGTLSIRTRWDGADRIVLEVHDNGCGIPSDVVPRIFDPLFTTKEAGQGTGLGLSIVRTLVEQHGGRVEVSTGAGEGTTMKMEFPTLATHQTSPGL